MGHVVAAATTKVDILAHQTRANWGIFLTTQILEFDGHLEPSRPLFGILLILWNS